MRNPFRILVPALVLGLALPAWGQEVDPVRPLLLRRHATIQSVLPKETILLVDPPQIERFLERLEGMPPNWSAIYGAGEDDHMDRLFEVNRERDRLREGKPALAQQVAFLWEGIASGYEPTMGGFRLAIGPKVIPTAWGLVRFKPDGLPPGLVAVASPGVRTRLRKQHAKGQAIDVDIVLVGHLLPEESIIYDFAHEEPGKGMIMPVVRVEQVYYFLAR